MRATELRALPDSTQVLIKIAGVEDVYATLIEGDWRAGLTKTVVGDAGKTVSGTKGKAPSPSEARWLVHIDGRHSAPIGETFIGPHLVSSREIVGVYDADRMDTQIAAAVERDRRLADDCAVQFRLLQGVEDRIRDLAPDAFRDPRRYNEPSWDVLVGLRTNLDESRQLLEFLETAFEAGKAYAKGDSRFDLP